MIRFVMTALLGFILVFSTAGWSKKGKEVGGTAIPPIIKAGPAPVKKAMPVHRKPKKRVWRGEYIIIPKPRMQMPQWPDDDLPSDIGDLDVKSAIERLSQEVERQVLPCWSIPVAAKNTQVHVLIYPNPNGTLRGEPLVVDSRRMWSYPAFRAVAESALRALRDPRCSPLKLPVKSYKTWRLIYFKFSTMPKWLDDILPSDIEVKVDLSADDLPSDIEVKVDLSDLSAIERFTNLRRKKLDPVLNSGLSQEVMRQLQPCWSILAGAKEAQNIQVHVLIYLNPDGTLRGEPLVVDSRRMRRDPAFRAVAESALRALRDPRCSPLKLPVKSYKIWRSIYFNFDTKLAREAH